MNAAANDLDLSVLSPDYREAFGALQVTAARAAEPEDIVKRLEHLVAELNHAVHGKKSEKLSEDDRQLAFEDLKIALAEGDDQKQIHAPGEDKPKPKKIAKRNRGDLPAGLPLI
jgi:transposase